MIVETETRWGRFRVLNTDRYVGLSLLAYGEFSPAEWRFLRSLVEPGDLVIDVGCNMGAITAPLAYDDRVVVAFEAQPELAELAGFNFDAATAFGETTTVVEVVAKAVGAHPGTIAVPVLDYDVENNFGGVALGTGERTVPMTTLDAELDPDRAVALIKADVEGMELDVLLGAQRTIERHRPLLYLEADRDDKVAPLLDHLIALDYRWHWHKPRLFSPDNYRNLPYCLEHLRNVVSANVIAIPRERPVERWEGEIAMGMHT